MGKKAVNATSRPQRSFTIREASTGKKQTNAKSLLKLQHLKNLAVWASVDASIPSLGAFFAHHLAASSEALGTSSLQSSLFTCQRCESILQTGYNCTIRIEKNEINVQNNIVYTCHFCSHRNIKKGTPKGHMREISPQSQQKSTPFGLQQHKKSTLTTYSIVGSIAKEPETSTRGEMGNVRNGEMSKVNSYGLTKDNSSASSPLTPLARESLTLLESKKRKRNRSGAKKSVASESYSERAVNTCNRRRRKSWTSLKEIAENYNSKKFINLTVPFSIW